MAARDIYSGHSPPGGEGISLSKLKNREEFEGGLGKGRKRGEKKKKRKRVINHTLKYLTTTYSLLALDIG